MQTQINYEKYEKMSEKQLFNSIINVKKKEKKIQKDSEKKLKDIRKLLGFLENKLEKEKSKKKAEKYYSLDEIQIFKDIEKWEKENPQEAAKIRKELEYEIPEFKGLIK